MNPEFGIDAQQLSVHDIGVSYPGQPVVERINPVEITQRLVQNTFL